MQISFANSLTDWQPKVSFVQDFLAGQAAQWGRPNFNWTEFLTPDTTVRIYLDRDRYLPHAHPPPQQTLQQERQQLLDKVQHMFGDSPEFDPSRHVHLATRHGLVPAKNQYKISIRCYISCFSIRMGDIPKLLRHFDPEEYFDLAPYSARQKLGIPGACKGKDGDYRVLQLEDGVRPEDCIAQLLTGDEISLDFDKLPDNRVSESDFRGQAPAEWETVAARLEEAGFLDPRYVSRRKHSLTFSCSNRAATCPCPCCRLVHDRQNWSVASLHNQEKEGVRRS